MLHAALANWRALHVPKRGNGPEEYEDAFAGNPEAGRFAIADGASESSFALQWAGLLVEEYVRPVPASPDGLWLNRVRERWSAAVDGTELPWYAESKREQGAFAAFLGLVFGPERRAWQAVAVGDSCLFQIRRGELRRAFPVCRSKEFGNQPPLLGSRAAPGQLRTLLHQRSGHWKRGDRFFLMTDALAHWFLQRREDRERPWMVLESLVANPAPEAAFADWVTEQRTHAGLRNDDVTLVAICL